MRNTVGYFQPYVYVLDLFVLSTNTDNKSNVSQSEYMNTKHFHRPHKKNYALKSYQTLIY